MNRFRLCSAALMATVAATATHAEMVTLEPIKDNTLYESPIGTLSNGMGQHFFAGRTGQATRSVRRTLLAFDIAGNIPAGATINQVTLTLRMSRTPAGTQTVSLHRVLADWGEGTSNAGRGEGGGAAATPGDATWIHTFFDTSVWANPGGDFSNTVSASRQVGGIGSYAWGSTPQMVADVQSWLDQPAINFGWMLIGNEAVSSTAKRFDSRQSFASVRPSLTIDFTNGGTTSTPTPTATPVPPTLTRTPTRTRTATLTRTPTTTRTRTPTNLSTFTPTMTPTGAPTATPTEMPIQTATTILMGSPTGTEIASETPTLTPTGAVQTTGTPTLIGPTGTPGDRTPSPIPIACVGDCDSNGTVGVSNMILGVNLVLGLRAVSECPAFADMNGNVGIPQLIVGVNNLLNGCPT